ncbi:MAG TPA: response regulator [bacterium]|nr:response regulator [bacterium]
MTKVSVLIADDERFAREELKHQLSVYPELLLVGEADNGIEAVKTIKELRPDLLFLDIEMPGLKGIEVIEALSSMPDYRPFIVIVTAYENYAVKAFEYDVLDYLLKPVDTKRLATTMSRVLKYTSGQQCINRIAAKRLNRMVLIPEEEISFVGVEDSVVYIKCGIEKYSTTYRTLDDIEKDLDNKKFVRVHRAYIVNIKKVREIKNEDSGGLLLRLEDVQAEEIPVSRTNAKAFKSIFKL